MTSHELYAYNNRDLCTVKQQIHANYFAFRQIQSYSKNSEILNTFEMKASGIEEFVEIPWLNLFY